MSIDSLVNGMIVLKKNDKIIIIVAIVILIFAGVGVALYQAPPKTTYQSPPISGETQTYNVSWPPRNSSLPMISEFAYKKTPFQGTVKIEQGNLKMITFNLTWTDDHMTFFKRMGLDTLTLEVGTPDGRSFIETNTSAPITGQGSVTVSIAINIIPPTTVKADSEQAAQAMLTKKPYYDDSWTNKDINYSVSVHVGEVRLLKKFRDKGNTFDLTVSYQYLEGTLQYNMTKNTGLDNTDTVPEDPWVHQTPPPYTSMILRSGYGRMFI
jgi:hypothetical protein